MTAKKSRPKKPKATKALTSKKRGRPTVFNDTIQEKILNLAKDGATDVQLAEAIGVNERTIRYWKKKHADFFPALKDAKNLADQMVEASLFQRACGYQHKAVKLFPDKQLVMEWVQDPDDPDNPEARTLEKRLRTVIIEHEYTEHYPPDTVAGIFWLKNRQPDRWREKPTEPDPKDNGQTTIVYDTEWGGTGEPDSPSSPQDSDGEPK